MTGLDANEFQLATKDPGQKHPDQVINHLQGNPLMNCKALVDAASSQHLVAALNAFSS